MIRVVVRDLEYFFCFECFAGHKIAQRSFWCVLPLDATNQEFQSMQMNYEN